MLDELRPESAPHKPYVAFRYASESPSMAALCDSLSCVQIRSRRRR